MPVKKRSKKQKFKRAVREAPLELSLPTKRSKPVQDMLQLSWLIYGAKKIGKTSMCARFPDAMCLMCEPGGKSLEIYQRPVPSWKHFTGYLDLLLEGKHNFKTVVIDTVDELYDRCFEHMCKKLVIEHPNDEKDYGKSWGLIGDEFVNQLKRLLESKLGVVLISHMKFADIEKPDGEIFKTIVPTVSNQGQKFLTAVIDIWACYKYVGEHRYLEVRGSDFIGAGVRTEKNFLHPKSKKPIRRIPMGNTADEAYHNLREAFFNRLNVKSAKLAMEKGAN